MSLFDNLSSTVAAMAGALDKEDFAAKLAGTVDMVIGGIIDSVTEGLAHLQGNGHEPTLTPREMFELRYSTQRIMTASAMAGHGRAASENGLYPPNLQPVNLLPYHPCQDPYFPFVYDPSTDEYIGYRWDYGDVGPMVPPLSVEQLHALGGLYLALSPFDYYCSHGDGWDARFTVVAFKKPQYFRLLNNAITHYTPLIQHAALTDAGETSGQYLKHNLHPQATSLAQVGYNAILQNRTKNDDPGELFLFDPKTQVTRTSWVEWKGLK